MTCVASDGGHSELAASVARLVDRLDDMLLTVDGVGPRSSAWGPGSGNDMMTDTGQGPSVPEACRLPGSGRHDDGHGTRSFGTGAAACGGSILVSAGALI
jgi:hypothetical protein